MTTATTYTVQNINEETNRMQDLLTRETYEGAHYEAYGFYQQSGRRYVQVVRGDVMIWNSKDGYVAG
jgi:hypothetical protein